MGSFVTNPPAIVADTGVATSPIIANDGEFRIGFRASDGTDERRRIGTFLVVGNDPFNSILPNGVTDGDNASDAITSEGRFTIPKGIFPPMPVSTLSDGLRLRMDRHPTSGSVVGVESG